MVLKPESFLPARPDGKLLLRRPFTDLSHRVHTLLFSCIFFFRHYRKKSFNIVKKNAIILLAFTCL